MQRPINKTWYFINIRNTIDAIKYRVFNLTKAVKGDNSVADEKKDFYCPQCKSRYDQLEVLDKFDPSVQGFRCHKCDHILERDDESALDRGGHEKHRRVMSQLRPILELLQQIDESFIEDITFNIAHDHRLEVKRNNVTNPMNTTVPIVNPSNKPSTVKGLTGAAPANIDVMITT